MKTVISIFIVASFISIAVFGFWGMSHVMESGHNNCIAATARGVACPKEINPFAIANLHLDALRSFSLATVAKNFLNEFASFLVILFMGLGIAALFFSNPLRNNPSRSYRFLASFSSPRKQQLTRWLSLHENSPGLS